MLIQAPRDVRRSGVEANLMGFWSKVFGSREPPVMPVHVDDSNFRAEVVNSTQPVLLDVWGPGCAPCRQLEPIVIRLTKRYQGRVKVAELNAAESPETASRLHVLGTPTVLYFKGGRIVERVAGFRGELYHEEVIEHELLGSSTAKPTPSSAI